MRKNLYFGLGFLIVIFCFWIVLIGKFLGLSIGISIFVGFVFSIFVYYASILINALRLSSKGGDELVKKFFSDLKDFQTKYFK